MEATPRSHALVAVALVGTVGLAGLVAAAAEPPSVALDPLAKALIGSIRQRDPRTAPDLLEAAIMAADADAVADALDFYRRFVDVVSQAGDGRADLLADCGDRLDAGALRRLERTLAPYEPDVARALGAVHELAAQRRRDPARLAASAAALRDPAGRKRVAAADELARAGAAALPVLVDLLQTDDAGGGRARAIARGLVHDMGADGRAALLAWLGSDDVAHWPGVIAGLAAGGDEDAVYFLAPALVADAPPPVRLAAAEALASLGIAPSADEARAMLAAKLDATLTQAALPEADTLEDKTVEWFVWNPQRRGPERRRVSTRLARAQTAIHLARDLAALAPTDPAQVRLVLLARLETLTALAESADGSPALDAIPPQQVTGMLAGPDGFDAVTVAAVLDAAAERGLTASAAAAARAIRLAATTTTAADPLPPAARKPLVRALSAPDPALAFEAAHTMAVCAGDPPFAGASLVVRNLLHAATSTGVDQAIVAHPDIAVAEELAAGLGRHGYRTVRVRDGREAILAARASADTALVVLAARLGSPSALETVHLLQMGSDLAPPPVLVAVDPLDDDPRGCFLTRLIQAFADVECVAIVDRMESFFQSSTDPRSGAELPPRFLDALAVAAGPHAGRAERRAAEAAARLARAQTALATLAMLAERGWDVRAAVPTARLALAREDLHRPAVALLAAVGDASAQQALFRETIRRDVPAEPRDEAHGGFAASVRRHGILLESHHLLRAYRMYNQAPDAESRVVAGDLLDVLEAPRMQPEPTPADAP